MSNSDYLEKYKIHCSRKGLPTVSVLKVALENAVETGEKLTVYRLNGNHPVMRGNRLTDEILETILTPMAGLSFLKQLDLSFNELKDTGALALAKFLKDDIGLEVLDLKHNNISTDGIVAIAKSLHYNEKLAYLDLSYNDVGDEGGMALASMLQINGALSTLKLSSCSLGAKSLIGLSTVLQTSTSIVEWDISNNMLRSSTLSQSLVSDVMTHISRTIELNSSIRHLDLSKFGITDWVTCDLLCHALKANTSIEMLNLGSNRISRDGGVSLCAALVKHMTLSTLKLTSCSLQDEGAQAIATLLSQNRQIKEIYLEHNKISGNGLMAIASALRHNYAIKFIALWGNNWDVLSCQTFSELVGGPFRQCNIEPVQGNSRQTGLLKKTPRFKPSELDVSFYEVEGVLQVAYAPRKEEVRMLLEDEDME